MTAAVKMQCCKIGDFSGVGGRKPHPEKTPSRPTCRPLFLLVLCSAAACCVQRHWLPGPLEKGYQTNGMLTARAVTRRAAHVCSSSSTPLGAPCACSTPGPVSEGDGVSHLGEHAGWLVFGWCLAGVWRKCQWEAWALCAFVDASCVVFVSFFFPRGFRLAFGTPWNCWESSGMCQRRTLARETTPRSRWRAPMLQM